MKTWCVGGKHYSNTNNFVEYEKVNPRTKKLVKIIKGTCSICDRKKSQIFTKKMTRGQNFVTNANILTAIDQLCQIQHGVI